MQTKKDDSAFPIFDDDANYFTKNQGLTKREYFAAMALQGLLNVPFVDESYLDEIPKMAIELADNLIRELNNSGSVNGK